MRVNKTRLSVTVATIACAVAMSFAAQAAPVTFFGEDLNPGGDSHTLSSFPNSTAARNSLFTNLVGVGTETFDGFSVGTVSPTAVFNVPSGTVHATLNGGTIATGNDGAGRYPISSPNYLFAGTSSFTVNFDTPIAAFGFFGTDIGDFGGKLSLTLTDATNHVSVLAVPNLLGNCGGTPCSDPTSGSGPVPMDFSTPVTPINRSRSPTTLLSTISDLTTSAWARWRRLYRASPSPLR